MADGATDCVIGNTARRSRGVRTDAVAFYNQRDFSDI